MINNNDKVKKDVILATYYQNISNEDVSGSIEKLEHYIEAKKSFKKFKQAIVAYNDGIIDLRLNMGYIEIFIDDK